MSACGCSDDALCPEAKKLWKLKRSEGRRHYSFHRMNALKMLDEWGKPKHNGYTIWANNVKTL